ncbi:MAG: leucine--tRNA ligase [Candidatus Micrarchaeota archaeon]|nr:MAG: leucine--tRNA ligase [Candidatus Micrarchaeota archaeon]
MSIDLVAIENKWNEEWLNKRIFEAEVIDNKKPYMIVPAFPYVNGNLHIGHIRTYTTADVVARYKRMRGYNVLYPIGFHATGTPIVAVAERLANNDQDMIKQLKNDKIPEDVIQKMRDPIEIVNYFIPRQLEAFKRYGMSIDYRRQFVSIEPLFSKFIEWQFNKLYEKGVLVKGTHYVGWCPLEKNAVGQHDTKGDVQPEIEKLVAIKFKLKDSNDYILCLTYRPETIFGATNLFINKNAKYRRVLIDNVSYIVSNESIIFVENQFNNVEVKDDVLDASSLEGKLVVNPVNNEEIPIWTADFVEPDFGTGAVMSVPMHDAFDYVYSKVYATSHGLELKPRKLIDTKELDLEKLMNEVYNEATANNSINRYIIEKYNESLYKKEFKDGILTIEPYKGMNVKEARERVKEYLLSNGYAIDYYIIANKEKVKCRCGALVVPKIINDQWFIDYGNKEWKKLAKELLDNAIIFPDKARKAFYDAAEWISLRAAERSNGLGTRFPFNKDHIIESLSDSTIYMTFYTYVHILRDKKIRPEQLSFEFFDYVINGIGDPETVSEKTGIDISTLKSIRESFSYWYSYVHRHSGYDLIPSHLTMAVFNHALILNRENWLKVLSVNGYVIANSEKMSKSLGNVLLALDMADKYGADVVRLAVAAGANLFSEYDFTDVVVNGIKESVQFLFDLLDNISSMNETKLKAIDYWLYSKLNRKIKEVTEYMESLELREAYVRAFYESINELKRYIHFNGNNPVVITEFLEKLALLLNPIMPHVSEELWHRLGNESFASLESWPTPNEELIDDSIEAMMDIIDSNVEDIKRLTSMLAKKNKSYKRIEIYIAKKELYDIYNSLVENINPEELKNKYSNYASIIDNYTKKLKKGGMRLKLDKSMIYELMEGYKEHLRSILNTDIVILDSDNAAIRDDKMALPDKFKIRIQE